MVRTAYFVPAASFYNEKLKTADVLVFAGAVVDRQLSWKWREFFDRSFFNTHTPSLTGKQIAFLVSGPLSQLPDLRLVYEAWVELQHSHLAAFLSDEAESSAELGAALDGLAERLVRLVTALPGIRSRWPAMIRQGMLRPYQRVLRAV